jgi:hypothetical protein
MGLSFVDEPLLRSLVATLVDVFPHVQLFQPGNRPAVMFVASREPLDVERDSLRALGAAPDFFATFGLSTREDVAAALVLDDAGARSLAAGAPLVRDDWNLLQMRSPGEPRRAITERVDGVARIRGRGLSSAESRRLFEAHDRRTGLAPDVEPIRLVRALIDFGDDERASRVADALADPAARHAARGWVAASRGDVAAAKREMKAALRIDAADHEARAGLLVLEKRKLGDGVEPGRLGLSALSRSEAALVEGWRQERRRDFEGARGLEAELATIRPGDALFREATRLRASWRVASADPEHAREARQLLDLSLARSIDAGDLLLRARAALLAGETDPALATLSELRDRLGAVRGESPEWVAQRAQIARDALRVLEDLPRDDARPGLGSVLREHFQRLASTGRLG